ncbi:MAG TPA: hypothetical protein VEK77_13105 [Gemmatimonadales bacterium]|nr:hypothetical protein [Gemmatimonadales bacterium]
MADDGRVLVCFLRRADVPTLGTDQGGAYAAGDVAGFAPELAAHLVASGAARYATTTDLAVAADPQRGLNPGTHERPAFRGRLLSETRRIDGHHLGPEV